MIEFYNRTSYWLFIIEIPHLRGKELKSAIKIKLSSLYPGNIDETNIQIRKNGGKKYSYLVFVLDENTGKTMLPLSPLFVQFVNAKKTANVLYVDKQWIDHVRIENGEVLSSNVKIRNESLTPDDFKDLYGNETDLEIYCNESDKSLFALFEQNKNIQFYDSRAELKKVDVHKISLFSEKSPIIKQRRISIAVIILILTIAVSWLLYQHRKSENELNAQLRLEEEQQRKAALEKQLETERLAELRRQYQEIINSKTAAPFDIAAIIADCSDRQTRIQSATFNGNFFQIEGITGNSLNLLGKFENHRLISNARLHQVHPNGGSDTFGLSGNAQAETVPIDETIAENEQIAILESLIAAETNYGSTEANLSPSAFGEAVKALFAKWGCTANSYQFMNDSNETEVEFSLRGPGSGFFNALYEIKTKHRLWDVRLTQIRNLYPRNLLDIVIRIKTEYSGTKTDKPDAAHAEVVNPYPIANISRNYFAATPEPRRPAEPANRVQPAVATVPARAEKVLWLEYIGSVNDNNDSRFIYVKNTNTGGIIRLGNFSEGNMRYAAGPSGSIIAYIDDQIYEINRR